MRYFSYSIFIGIETMQSKFYKMFTIVQYDWQLSFYKYQHNGFYRVSELVNTLYISTVQTH